MEQNESKRMVRIHVTDEFGYTYKALFYGEQVENVERTTRFLEQISKHNLFDNLVDAMEMEQQRIRSETIKRERR